uniref:Uncharacterized protein n=1 Tax=Chloracidobacterium thermophilum TaxID=458033 RepID=A8DJP9_9BACT|nr:hypothetical protein YS_M60-F11.141 [Chloracidobacterium thermophilum]
MKKPRFQLANILVSVGNQVKSCVGNFPSVLPSPADPQGLLKASSTLPEAP